MKLTVPRILLALLSVGVACTAAAADLGNVMYVGDSITHGVGAASYRWQMHKILVDNGISYAEQGVQSGNYSGGVQPGTKYGYVGFENVHSSQSSARAWEISGRSAGSRFGGSNIRNWLGQSETKANGTTYTGSVITGSSTPDVFMLLIGTNDLLSDGGGVNVESNLASKTTNLLGSDLKSGDMGTIVDSMYTANASAAVYVSTIPCWTRHGNSNDAAYHRAVQTYNVNLTSWVKNYNQENGTKVVLMDPNRGIMDVAAATPFTGVESMFRAPGSDGLHPNAQGDLIMAGNYARAMGLAGRTAGQERKAAAGFETVLSSPEIGQGGISMDWETAPEYGFTVDLAGLGLGDGSENGLNTTDLFSVTLGNGSLQGQLDISEAYISWGSTILFSEDMSTLGEDIRIAYVGGNEVEGVGAGFYVWLGDMLIGEGLAAVESDTAHNGVSLSYSGNGTLTLDSVAFDGTGSYAPTTGLLSNSSSAFLMSIPQPVPPATPQGTVTWPSESAFTKTSAVSASTGQVDAMSGITSTAKDAVGVTLTAGSMSHVYANTTTRSGDVWVDVTSGSVTAWYAAQGGSGANLTGNVTLRISGESTGGSTVFGIVNSGSVSGDVTLVLDAAGATYGSFTGTDSSSIVGAYEGNIGGSFKAVINAGTFSNHVMGGIYQGSGKSIGKTEIYVNGGTIRGNVYGGGRQGSIGASGSLATQVTVTGGTLEGAVYGGGKGGSILGDTAVTLAGGVIKGNIYGGGEGGTISGSSSVTIDGNLAIISSSLISAGGSGGSIAGNAVLTIRNAFVSNYTGSIDKYAGTLSGGSNVAGTRELRFESSDLAGTRFDAVKVENFDAVSLKDSQVVLSSLGGATALTLSQGSVLTVTEDSDGLRLVQMDTDCSLTLKSLPMLGGAESLVIELEGDISALDARFITLTDTAFSHGAVLENVYFLSNGTMYEAQVAWLDQQASMRNLVLGQVVPEPATGTLGLLALCGLVMRRRRK